MVVSFQRAYRCDDWRWRSFRATFRRHRMKKKQHSVVAQAIRTNPKIGSAITRVRLPTPPPELDGVFEGPVDGRRFLLKMRVGLIAKEECGGVWKWQL